MVLPSPDPVTAMATKLATKTFGELLAKLTSNVMAAAGKPLNAVYESITTNFKPHLEVTYQRCTKIKTILNREEPVDLFSLYVGSYFSCAGTTYDDFGVIEQIRSRKRAVVSGTGGSGKTIFMKYLWLSLFESPEGKIPVFVELRKLNEISTDNILAYIHHSMVNTNATVSEESFKKTVAKGSFAFLFDGFDEVAPEKRSSISKQIQDIAENNPECIVVVSSRPDDEIFSAWQTFSIFKVQPLSAKQAVALIQKLQYDEAAKAKFIARIEKDLYRMHQSFLSVPLLATMMLMTFSDFGDVPRKTYLFYDKAFDTLFYKHDSVKGLFQRKTYTGLPVDVFKRQFSTFCLVSYFEGKFEFNVDEIKDFIRRGLKIEKAQIDVDKFLKDLVESVCILQKDGNLFVFSHRSFQEYFAAFCLDRVVPDRARKILEKIAARRADTAIEMLFEMNSQLVESEFVLPILSEVEAIFKSWPKEEFIKCHSLYMQTVYEIKFNAGKLCEWIIMSSSPLDRIMMLIGKLYEGDKFFDVKTAYYKQDEKVLTAVFPGGSLNVTNKRKVAVKPGNQGSIKIVAASADDGGVEFEFKQTGVKAPAIESADWLESTGYAAYCRDKINILSKIKSRVQRKQKAKRQTIDELLDI